MNLAISHTKWKEDLTSTNCLHITQNIVIMDGVCLHVLGKHHIHRLESLFRPL